MSKAEKRWNILPPLPDAESFGRRVGLSPIGARLLLNRGIENLEAARRFLQPELGHLHDPFLMPGMDEAAGRILRAVEKGEHIVIYGDYDVDGMSATAILMRCLRLLGATPEYYVPDRLDEGYGLNADAVRKIAAEGADLIVTVDCGISAVEEVMLASELGVETIVTDHHEPGDLLPREALVINPKLPGSSYPFRDLAGAGIAFKLAWAVGKSMAGGNRVAPEFKEFLIDAVCLAALGTIADVVPLRGENRTLAHFGLKAIASSAAPAMATLREAAGLTDGRFTAMDVAYRIAPRLNAAGRLGSARWGIELLTTDSLDRAREIAARLTKENSRRQRIQENVLAEALAVLEGEGGAADRRTIVLAGEGWHAGVVGVVAARLTEEYWRPTVLLTLEDGVGHGSARAVAPMHLFEALQRCKDRLIAFGGHARAAGLRLREEDLEAFKRDFETAAAAQLSAEDLIPVLDVDGEARLADIDGRLLADIERLAPFGEGNPEPVLVSRGVTAPAGTRRMGTGGRHLSFYANQNGAAFRAVAFGKGDMADALDRARTLDIAYVPRINRYRGRESIELDIRDIKIVS